MTPETKAVLQQLIESAAPAASRAPSQGEQLAALRAPFDDSAISQLPRQICDGCRDNSCTQHEKTRCDGCGAWVGLHVHIPYVGHAEVTDRLNDVDPLWNWEPVALDEIGRPYYETRQAGRQSIAEMWAKLTIAGHTRLCVGTAKADKPELLKELIGDAIRNGAMRFGVALDCWAKSDIHDRPGLDTTGGGLALETINEEEVNKLRDLFDVIDDENERSRVKTEWVDGLDRPPGNTPRHLYAQVYASAEKAVKQHQAAGPTGNVAEARAALRANRVTLKHLEDWRNGFEPDGTAATVKLNRGKVAAVLALAEATGLDPLEVVELTAKHAKQPPTNDEEE